MKNRISPFSTLIVIIFLVNSFSASAQSGEKKAKSQKNLKKETIGLFNGKDLNNWVFQLKDTSVDPNTVFNVQNGVIHISGNPFGYMRTKDTYSDYRLHVEWRWPSEPTNSGVFVHVQEPDVIWPKCIECNLQAGNAGGFVCMNGAEMDEHTDKSKISIKRLTVSSEKPVGEWNIMEVVCKANTIEVFVNGVLQNKGTNVSLSKGHICLQSEGKDIEIRNVFLNKLMK